MPQLRSVQAPEPIHAHAHDTRLHTNCRLLSLYGPGSLTHLFRRYDSQCAISRSLASERCDMDHHLDARHHRMQWMAHVLHHCCKSIENTGHIIIRLF